jgi:hypothetical protein
MVIVHLREGGMSGWAAEGKAPESMGGYRAENRSSRITRTQLEYRNAGGEIAAFDGKML